jgi:hypothetical protein
MPLIVLDASVIANAPVDTEPQRARAHIGAHPTT